MPPSVLSASSKRETDRRMQLQTLIGLRLIEHLGRDQPNRFLICYPRQDGKPMIQILNWISLCIVSYSTSSYSDVAVAMSAQPGKVVIHISSGSGSPGEGEHERVSLFLDVLRRVLIDDLDPPLISYSYLDMLADRALPQIIQKIARIRKTGDGSPVSIANRFCALVSQWEHFKPNGEASIGFMKVVETEGRTMTESMVQSFLGLVFHELPEPERMNAEQKYDYMISTLTSCDLLVHSTFFCDAVKPVMRADYEPQQQPEVNFRESLDILDELFLHELWRCLSHVACYKSGAEKFANRCVPFLKNVLGPMAINDFIMGNGGIVVNWVHSDAQPCEPSLQWPIGPSEAVCDVLEVLEGDESFDLDHLDHDMRKHISQTSTVTGAWTQGEAVKAHTHCELRMIFYLEGNLVDVVEDVIGLSQPMCWACHCYIAKFRPLSRWKLSQTLGKARDDWRLPMWPSDLAIAMLRTINWKVRKVVEEYALGMPLPNRYSGASPP